MLSRGNFDEKSLDEANRVINLNVVSLVHLTHGAVKHFKKINRDCYLLNVGSLNSVKPASLIKEQFKPCSFD